MDSGVQGFFKRYADDEEFWLKEHDFLLVSQHCFLFVAQHCFVFVTQTVFYWRPRKIELENYLLDFF